MRKSDEGTTNAGKTRPHTPPQSSLRPTSRHTHRRHSWPSRTRGLVRCRRRLPRRRPRPSRAETDIAKGYQLIQVLKVVAVPSPTPRTCRRRSRRARGATGAGGPTCLKPTCLQPTRERRCVGERRAARASHLCRRFDFSFQYLCASECRQK